MFMLLLTVAGNETTRNTTAWGMWALMENPEQYKELRDNLDTHARPRDRRDPALGHAGVPLPPHRHRADTEFHGQEIKQGDKVVMWHISANRDEAVFDDPFTFDITRWPERAHRVRRRRRHFCLGANLARMELQADLPGDPRSASPTCTSPASPTMLRSNFIGGVKHMPVEYTPGARRSS